MGYGVQKKRVGSEKHTESEREHKRSVKKFISTASSTHLAAVVQHPHPLQPSKYSPLRACLFPFSCALFNL